MAAICVTCLNVFCCNSNNLRNLINFNFNFFFKGKFLLQLSEKFLFFILFLWQKELQSFSSILLRTFTKNVSVSFKKRRMEAYLFLFLPPGDSNTINFYFLIFGIFFLFFPLKRVFPYNCVLSIYPSVRIYAHTTSVYG